MLRMGVNWNDVIGYNRFYYSYLNETLSLVISL